MLRNWFKSKDVDEFADSIVADLARRFPPAGIDLSTKKAPERMQKMHGAIFSRVEAFARSTHLNLYRTARLGNRVKWSLMDAGYPKSFVDTFTHELVAVLTVCTRTKKVKKQN